MDGSNTRAASFKARSFRENALSARRATFLRRQEASRRNLTGHLRMLQCNDPDTQEQKRGPQEGRKAGSFQPWTEEVLCLPEWMVSVPEDLSSSWYICARPEGKRCIVVASRGRTTVRSRTGRHMRPGGPFRSLLPGGATGEAEKAGVTVLDCIIAASDPDLVYVLDVLSWNDHMFYECSFEFRHFWLETHMEGVSNDARCSVRFVRVPFTPATAESLEATYRLARAANSSSQHERADGLLFYHHEGHYTLGVSPLVLAWKDAATSAHAVEGLEGDSNMADAHEVPPLKVALKVGPGRSLATCDDVRAPFRAEPGVEAALRDHPDKILRFWLLNAFNFAHPDEDTETESEKQMELRYDGPCSVLRGFADSYSRIVFQCMIRYSPLRFEDLVSNARHRQEAAV